jgi:acetolactate synthase small subunit
MTVEALTNSAQATEPTAGPCREGLVLSVVMENKPGVLAHVCGLICSRGFNIISLAAGEADDARFSRMTVLASGDGARIELARKRLEGIVSVLEAVDVTDEGRAASLVASVHALLRETRG